MHELGMTNIIKELVNKNSIHYFMQNVVIDNGPLYEKLNQRQWYQYKNEKSQQDLQLQIVKYIHKLGMKGLIQNFVAMKILSLEQQRFITELI